MIEIVKYILKLGLVLYFGYKIKAVELSNEGNNISALQLVLNYSNGDISIYTNGRKWFDNTDVIIHQNNVTLSQSNGKLQMASTGPIVIEGKDVIGEFVGMAISWNSFVDPYNPHTRDKNFLISQARSYGNDVIAFSQTFPSGLTNTSLGIDIDSVDKVTTAYPSLQANNEEQISYLSYGGFMGGWAAASVGPLTSKYKGPVRIRDGEYGGPLVLYDEEFDNFLVISSLNNFMVSSMVRDDKNGDLKFGLMGSVESIPAAVSLDTVVVWGQTLRDAMNRWGEILRIYNGKNTNNKHDDYVSNFLGYWMDNGAYYYYNPLPNQTYEETIIEINDRLLKRSVPIRYVNYDSWFYEKGNDLGVKSWTALNDVFPNGLENLYSKTGLKVVAHNRYWATDNVYATQNGGSYNFIVENDTKRALPQDDSFWVDLFSGSNKDWGLDVYEQDWQDRQFVQMQYTHTDFYAGRTWLNQMGLGASEGDITIQYCMSLPREVLQSAEVQSVRRLRSSGDYILSKDNWRIGMTSLLASSLGLAPFKNVFWSTQRNPGNPFYYNCMEVANKSDSDKPWELNYRYTGYNNLTKSGYTCKSWYELEWHWKHPLNDLERDGCRSIPEMNEGRPFCFYNGSVDEPEEDWKWEECDIPVCEKNCSRPGMGDNSLPPCEEYIEPNPELQALVSLFSGGGVGIGDNLDFMDDILVKSTCRADGLLLSIENPLVVSPIQLQRMLEDKCSPSIPHSCSGEIWSGFTIFEEIFHFGVMLVAEIASKESISPRMLGLNEMNLLKECHVVYLRNSSITQVIGRPCHANVTINIPSVENHLVLYTSPIIQITYEEHSNRQAAILGETDKLGVISKSRISKIVTSPSMYNSDLKIEMNKESIFEIQINILGQQDEEVSLTWVDFFDLSSFNGLFHPLILKHECMIGKNNSAIFTIKFPFDSESFAECH